jgi:hypothetical protein
MLVVVALAVKVLGLIEGKDNAKKLSFNGILLL